MALQITKMGEYLGARVAGVDFAQPLTDTLLNDMLAVRDYSHLC